MNQPVIEVKNLSKSYNISHQHKPSYSTMRDSISNVLRKPLQLIGGEKMDHEKFWALNDLSFNVDRGEVVGIIGRNGSGKSTLLKVLSRITEPSSGEAILRGSSASLLEVGTGFHPELTGRENIFFNGSILGMKRSEIEKKFDEIVEFSEIEKFLDTPVKFYSSGMYVRLAFAVAAHLEPEILIIDEVLAVGDAEFQRKSLGKMKDVARSGRTVLFVSHSMASVKTLCDKGIFLDQGKIVMQGGIDEVAEAYVEHSLRNESTSLASRKRSLPTTGEARFTDISIKNTDSIAKPGLIDSTKPIEVQFTIESQDDLPKEVVLHCGIVAPSQMVLRFMSEHTNTAFKVTRGVNKISCHIQPTFLTGGHYSLDCALLFPGRESIGEIDTVPEAVFFTVKDLATPSHNDYLTLREAVYFVPHAWQKK